jgi:hypothetical protein
MNRTAAHLLTSLYPRRWRQRYRAEFEALLETQPNHPGTVVNVLFSAVKEHLSATKGGLTMPASESLGSLMKRPSAYLPLTMSLTALVMVWGSVAHYGLAELTRPSDEGAIAHTWQLLMAGQVPIILFFAFKWARRAPKQTLYVLAQQAAVASASVASVFFLGLG